MNPVVIFVFIAALAFIYYEFFADYLVQIDCDWPSAKGTKKNNVLKALIMADTHILGPIKGHWFDKMYREWHMKRSFEAALKSYRPDIIFILGDLFDEGYRIDDAQYQEHVLRIRRTFKAPKETALIAAVGNHDIGFHSSMSPNLIERFENNFSNTGVELYTIKGIHFVFINSMAMENDGCDLCEKALKQLKNIFEKLKTLQNRDKLSAPIVIQHFPTYRQSDDMCWKKDRTFGGFKTKASKNYRENWEVLSKNATDMIGKLLHPRLAFAGHTHQYCLSKNRWKVEEYTVPSFNFRDSENPGFLLSTFTQKEYAVTKCDLPGIQHLSLVILVASTFGIVWLLISLENRRDIIIYLFLLLLLVFAACIDPRIIKTLKH